MIDQKKWPGLFGRPLTILVISPQPWDGFKVSKHHYCEELAALGHAVYFIEPPKQSGKREVNVAETEIRGVWKVSYKPWFPYLIKFHAPSLFNWCMGLQAPMILSKIGKQPDIIWDFDNTQRFVDLDRFGKKAFKIFHPVDDIADGLEKPSADAILSVSRIFINRIANKRPAFQVPHGLNRNYQEIAKKTTEISQSGQAPSDREKVTVGYVGNLESTALDWPTFSSIIADNSEIDFRIIGPYHSDSSIVPVAFLKNQYNAKLLGFKSSKEIAEEAAKIDLWLICYDGSKNLNASINCHKILEYLATGKPIIANFIEAYHGLDLVTMPNCANNETLPVLFKEVVTNLRDLSRPDLQHKRAVFALEHTYSGHVLEIDKWLSSTAG